MSLEPIGIFQMAPFRGAPLQSLSIAALTAIVINSIANTPLAEALASTSQEVCEVLCSPLPGDKEGAAEQACQKVCTKDGVVTSTTDWLIDKAGKTIKAAAPVVSLLECSTVCDRTQGIKMGFNVGFDIAAATIKGEPINAGLLAAKTAFKAACTASAFFSEAACYACCGVVKVSGVI